MTRVRILRQAFHIFGYFNAHPETKLVFDPANTTINKNMFQQCDWMGFYRYAEEAIPCNIPVAGGNFMSTHYFIDANHSGDT